MSKKASMPGPGYKKARPEERIQGLVLSITPKTGKHIKLNLNKYPGSALLRQQLLLAAADLTGPTGTWDSRWTINSARTAIRKLLDWCESLGVEDFAELTPGKWNEIRLELANLEAGGYRGVQTLYAHIRAILKQIPEVPAETKAAAQKRSGVETPARNLKNSYSVRDFQKIREAAWQVVSAAHSRVHENYLHAQQYRLNELQPEDDPVGHALAEVLRYGAPQSLDGYAALDAFRGPELSCTQFARERLFIRKNEMAAAAVLMCCLEGLNKSTLEYRTVPKREAGLADTEVALTLVDDKPRRSPRHRYSLTTLSRDPATAVTLIQEMTDPIRNHLAETDNPTDRLLVCAMTNSFYEGFNNLSRDLDWWPEDVPPLDFRRLRLTVVNHIRKEPVGHSRDTWVDEYRGMDADLRAHALRAASRAAEEYEAKAATFFTGKVVAESDEENDTVLGGCSDFSHHPDTGDECTDGFLMCLGCVNFVVSPRHLPFQVALLDALEEMSTLNLPNWEVKFALAYARQKALLGDGTIIPTAAVKEARRAVTSEHQNRVRALLGGRYRP